MSKKTEHFGAEAPVHSIDLKTTAFKALLQGPGVFANFSSRFGISADDAQGWLAEAAGSLNLARDSISDCPPQAASCASQSLVREERRMLLGKEI